ncbi:Tetratricopeptide repeat protein [Caloramator mitchellensis]|uniref:Tetratricopeptide repeat protein n=1 Tax=Caloramator mitchellensis TaxID=908809 RepID=A0A0R3JWI0_CALMK|nr:tetratricopeptide repeat protein [Caloramator mitchellensis]KRQ87418.1 Tetratricopeptide repeat protein [Caloramator mitchellensis]
MNFQEYFKKQAHNLIFIEIEKDVNAYLKDQPITFPKGDYPVEPAKLLQSEEQRLLIANIIDGMLLILGQDKDFKLNSTYKIILQSIPNIESYIIYQIQQNRSNPKTATIYANALIELNPKKEFQMNRIYILMEYLNKTNQSFIQDEILDSLKKLTETHPDYEIPNFYLGEYYLDKDTDLAKHYLRKVQTHKDLTKKAQEYLDKIQSIENYDKAVDLLKQGSPKDALKILIPYIESNPNNLDAKYYAAVALRQLQNHQKALLYLQELLQALETPEVDNEIGLNLASLGYLEDAINYFEKAHKLNPKDTSIITNIGACYVYLNQIEKAKEQFEYALKINPNDEVAIEWLKQI